MKEGSGPKRHLDCSVTEKYGVCVCLESYRRAIGILRRICYVQALCEKSPLPPERSPVLLTTACEHSFVNLLLPFYFQERKFMF